MTLEQLVTDLAVSQQLKAAGFPQDTAFVWAEYGEGLAYAIETQDYLDPDGDTRCDIIAAPTAGELEEWLIGRGTIEYILSAMDEVGIMYSPDKRVNNCRSVRAHTLIAALAALVLEVAG